MTREQRRTESSAPGGAGRPGGPPAPPPPPTATGYNGKVLRVNLNSNIISVEELDPLFCRRYLGGAGFIAYYLWKELEPGVDALGPDNKLIFALGPVSGLQLPGAARHCIGAKSPLTGGIIKAETGGYWAAEFKRSGFDVLIVEGKADKPVYLFIQDGKVMIKDAGHLWGKETKYTQETIRTELGDNRIATCSIGIGGENMVPYSCIMSGLNDAAGRGGAGAVMGSKNLKAVAVRGHHLPKIADNERLKEIRKQMLTRKAPMSEFGTGGREMIGMAESGNLPVRNFRDGQFPEVEKITGVVLKDTIRIGMEGCYACHVRCKKVVQLDEPYIVDPAYGGPEYETLAALGSDCGIDDIKAICKGNERCGAYSLDTISTGGSIAFAMECFERGLLTKKDTGGIEFRFGNADAMLEAIELIARREGFGELLAKGTAGMAKDIGHGSEAFAMNAKGLEAGMHEPRLRNSLGISWIVGPTGADHMFGMGDNNYPMSVNSLHPLGLLESVPQDDYGIRRMALLKSSHCRTMINDSLITCFFTNMNPVDTLAAVTGWDTTISEQAVVGERILTTARMFNIKQGFTEDNDVLPERYYQGKTDGALADKPMKKEITEKARHYYYTVMGWDNKGVPTPETMELLYIE
jgi:aldehyde:ferredoxin oxidoreductase